MLLKVESNEKLSIPRDTLYSWDPVVAFILKCIEIFTHKSVKCRVYIVNLPEPCGEACIPRGENIVFLWTPSNSCHPASKVLHLLFIWVELETFQMCVYKRQKQNVAPLAVWWGDTFANLYRCSRDECSDLRWIEIKWHQLFKRLPILYFCLQYQNKLWLIEAPHKISQIWL